MSPLTLHRPRTLEEAIELLGKARPLGGGTSLVPERMDLDQLMDLQDLDLASIEESSTELIVGGVARLQFLLERAEAIQPVFGNAIRLEAGWNLRNAATLAGVIASGDGRSPFLTLLLACNPSLELEPENLHMSLGDFLKDRHNVLPEKLITEVRIPRPTKLAYHQVARSPADRPIVAAAAGLFTLPGENAILRVSLGGFGVVPILIEIEADSSELDFDIDEIMTAARHTYADAEDEWASSVYRMDVIGTLVGRGLQEVLD